MEAFDIADELLAEINRRLPFEQQIQKNDPLYTAIVLQKVALDANVQLIQKNLDDMLHQLTVASEQQVENATVIAERIISSAGNRIEKQVDATARRWEDRLRDAGREGELKIRQTAWLAWITEIVIIVVACIMLGSRLGSFLFDLAHHAK